MLCPQQRLTSTLSSAAQAREHERSKGRSPKKKVNIPWTEEELEVLRSLVARDGPGNWDGKAREMSTVRLSAASRLWLQSDSRSAKALAVAAPHWEFGGGAVLQVRGTQAAAEEGRPPGPAAQVRV